MIGRLKPKGADVLHMGCLTCAIECNDDCQTDSNLGRRDGDDKEHEDLGVVIRKAVRPHVEAGEADKREVRRIQHQL